MAKMGSLAGLKIWGGYIYRLPNAEIFFAMNAVKVS
jgi:hypothetical protein